MKIKLLMALVASLLLGTSSARAQGAMTLDHVDNALAVDSLPIDQVITFHLRLENTGGNITGYTNGFRIYSPTGATWTATLADSTGAITGAMVEQQFINPFSVDGAGADTVGFGGFKLFAPGIGAGFNEIVWRLHIGPIGAIDHCGEICLDSSFYRPAGLWKWSTTGGDQYATWDGPHCYTIVDPLGAPCGGGSNTAPVLDPIGDKSDDEGNTLAFGVSASDGDGDPLTIDMSSPDLPPAASFTDNGDGTGDFSWNTTLVDAGIYSATFTVSDGVDTDEETITITINETYQSPVIDAVGPQTTKECVFADFGLSAIDPESGTLTYTMVDNPTFMNLTDNGDGTAIVDFTPAKGDIGTYPVKFIVSSSVSSLADTVVVSITVDPNLAPTFISATPDQLAGEGDLVDFLITASDPETGLISASLVSAPAGAAFDEVTGQFTWQTQAGDAAGSPYMTIFTTDDGCNDPVEDTVMITVTAPNAAPVFDPIADQNLDETQTMTVNINVTDGDGDPITISVFSTDLPGAASFIDNGDGTALLEWITTYDDAGLYEVDLLATDGIANVHETFSVTVNNINRLPVLADPGNQFIDEGLNLNFGLSGSDPDGETLVLTMDSDAPGAILTDNGDNTATFDWTPTFADAGLYSATFWASDGTDSVSQAISITVNNINQNPVLDPIGDKVVAEGAPLVFGVSASDNDSDPITLAMINSDLPAEAIFTDNGDGTGSFAWSTTPADGGIYTATFTASDGNGGADSETVSIEVTDVNFPPVIEPISDFFITECDEIHANFHASNDDGDPITLNLDGMVANMTFVDSGNGTGHFIFLPDVTQSGSYILTLTADDGTDQDIEEFEVFVEDCQPGSEGDTLFIVNTPAIPGSVVDVPVNIVSLCDLAAFNVLISWSSPYLNLDDVDFTGSYIAGLTDMTVNIDNVVKTVEIHAMKDVGDFNIPAGAGLLCHLQFSISADAPDGSYQISPFLIQTGGLNPMFTRDCGSGEEDVQPFVYSNGGFVNVAKTETTVCGTVVDHNWNEIVGATVELWDMLPAGTMEMTTTTNSFGSFAFEGMLPGQYDLYAYAGGFYPGWLLDVNSGETGLIIQLQPHTTVTPTIEMVFFYCGGENAMSLFMGGPVPVGSIIDAYDPDGVRCGTQMVTTAGKYPAMPVYRDDPFTQEDEGANPGDNIRFFINGLEAIPYGEHTWTQDKDQFLTCLEVSDQVTQNCMLSEGWNLVSWRVDTPTDNIESVLSSLGDCVDFVIGFEQGGLAYDPDLTEFSTLHMVDHLSGYWIKVRQGCGDIMLDVAGMGVPVSTPIPVTTGWNLVSYLPENAIPTPDALASIHDNLIVAIGFDGGGTIYEPGMPGNNLTEMMSCLGYWVKVTQNDNLIYPGSVPVPAPKNITTPMAASDAGKPDVIQSTRWVNIYSHNLTLNGEKLGEGTVIAAHDENGVKVGHFTIGSKGVFGFMSVYGDDPMTEEIDGVRFGETFYLSVNGQPTDQRFSWTANGDRMEISGLTAKNEPEVLPNSYSLSQNYPNPFNPETNIDFSLAKAGQAKIEVFNILGELVSTPFDGVANAGQNRVIWDGTDGDGKSVASGIYFYRLTADNFSETKKMTLLK